MTRPTRHALSLVMLGSPKPSTSLPICCSPASRWTPTRCKGSHGARSSPSGPVQPNLDRAHFARLFPAAQPVGEACRVPLGDLRMPRDTRLDKLINSGTPSLWAPAVPVAGRSKQPTGDAVIEDEKACEHYIGVPRPGSRELAARCAPEQVRPTLGAVVPMRSGRLLRPGR